VTNSTPIDIVYADGKRLSEVLTAQKEVSLEVSTQANQRKILLLSTASWFEFKLCEAMRAFSAVHSNQHPGVQGVIRIKAIERQFHTWFDWKNKSAGSFYKLFGECGDTMKAKVAARAELKDGEKAFLELGQIRNELVHQNFAMFPLNMTSDEVYATYQRAALYVEWVGQELIDPQFGRQQRAATAPQAIA